MKKINYEEQECPLCGEYLNFNKDVVMKNKINGDFIYVFTCEECNQAFALDKDGKMKLLPYNSDMKQIINKCKICGIVENFNEKGLFLLNADTAYYKFHCFNCAIKILQDWIDKNGKKKIKVNLKNVNGISKIYDFNKNDEMLKELNKNPKKYKEATDKLMKSLEEKEKKELSGEKE